MSLPACGTEFTPFFDPAEYPSLFTLPRGAVVCLTGAGGKTTLLHTLAGWYRGLGLRVLAGTTTHMMREENVCGTEEAVLEALSGGGYALGGLPDPRNPRKMIGFGEEVWRHLSGYADMTILEADGSRHMPLKVPYPHEPCVVSFATHIAVLYGEEAVGSTAGLCAYNPEGVRQALSELGLASARGGEDPVLSEEMIRMLLDHTYVRLFRERYPGIPVMTVCARKRAAAG